jgi:hypothetical protein
VRYDRLVDNGASFVLQQCLYREKAEVIFNQRVLAIPKDFQKVTINMAGLQSFDNQTRERHPELDVATRRVEVEISLRLSQAAVTRTSSGQAETLGDIAVPGSSRVDSVSFASSNFSLSMAVPNFAVFSTSEGAAFNYTLEPIADAYGLVLKFAGTFDTVNYDPHFGMLLPGSVASRSARCVLAHSTIRHSASMQDDKAGKTEAEETTFWSRCWCQCSLESRFSSWSSSSWLRWRSGCGSDTVTCAHPRAWSTSRHPKLTANCDPDALQSIRLVLKMTCVTC